MRARDRADGPVSPAEAKRLFGALENFPALILAVSGGPDSTALMWLAARWRDELEKPPKLVAITIDHRLRRESAHEARAVGRLAKSLNVEHVTLRWSGRKPKTGIQEVARNARYRLLADAARKSDARHILTGHTLDDQAETVLFRLARGSGIAGLRGMAFTASLPGLTRQSIQKCRLSKSRMDARAKPAHDEALLIRPFLSIPKTRLLATLRAAKIPFADDRTNRDPRFTRPRLRELMPKLAAEGLDARRLAVLARRMQRADQAIERATDDAQTGLVRQVGANRVVLGANFIELPAEVGLRLLGRMLAKVGDEGPVELGKLEVLYSALAAAMSEPHPARFRRTLAGALVTLTGEITLEPAPPRRSRKAKPEKRTKASFTKDL